MTTAARHNGPVEDVVGVLLAGGLSRRMGGGDKCLAELAGRTMLEHAIARLRPQVGWLVLSANGDPSRFARFCLPVVPDPVSPDPVPPDPVEGYAGPLAGVLAGMRWAARHAPDAPWIVTAATDAPFLPRGLVARLKAVLADIPGGDAPDIADAANAADALGAPDALGAIALARSRGRLHPVFGLWPVALADDLEAALASGVRKVLDWTDRHDMRAVDFPPEHMGGMEVDPFFNANRPSELVEARALVEAGSPVPGPLETCHTKRTGKSPIHPSIDAENSVT